MGAQASVTPSTQREAAVAPVILSAVVLHKFDLEDEAPEQVTLDDVMRNVELAS